MRNEAQNMTNTPLVRNQNNHYSPVYEAGQLRRAKMHAAHLTSDLESRRNLPPALLQLLETSILLKTIDSKVLSRRLRRKQDAILADLQKIRPYLIKETD